MNRTRILSLAAMLLITLGAQTLKATITVDNYWRLGESDAGAVAGNAVNSSTIDSVSSLNPTLVGTAQYTASTANASFSSLGVSLGASSYYMANNVTLTANDNFGIEGFFNLNAGGGYLLHNGDLSVGNGYGFLFSGTQLVGHFSGVNYVYGPNLALNTWVHLAMVRDSGTTTLYVDGVALGSNSSSVPGVPSSTVYLGDLQAANSMLIDEVRFFHFTAGQFAVNDLLFASVPEPQSYFLIASALFLLMLAGRQKMRKQSISLR